MLNPAVANYLKQLRLVWYVSLFQETQLVRDYLFEDNLWEARDESLIVVKFSENIFDKAKCLSYGVFGLLTSISVDDLLLILILFAIAHVLVAFLAKQSLMIFFYGWNFGYKQLGEFDDTCNEYID